ncbi:uncharacterized protein LOC124434710 isoform X2 [Xenia sp. Carnegie-2017]|uniref:uncharacterized protein LOC124434710 isoform X2 n=1 Tax=Xenia sp. Carnegie-2017 TaxID=2897299 RepID=UPI001F037696|nr:uncharacterized protein LOC124434710 isoform X2 [Xenia sp. Carnegie-2017]
MFALSSRDLVVFTCCIVSSACVLALSSIEKDGAPVEQNRFSLSIESRCRDRLLGCDKPGFCYKHRAKFWKRMIRRNCKKTCGHCRAPSPPACVNSEFGCCWDYITTALGPGGLGCTRCEDNIRYPYVCKRFRKYCRKSGVSGKWMRLNCPNACGHCDIWQFK